MAVSLTDFMAQLERNEAPAFTVPQYRYGPKEDSLFFYFRPDEHYADRLNSLVTVFRAHGDDRLVGCQVKGLMQKLKNDGKFCLLIQNKGKLELGLFFHRLAYDLPEADQRDALVELGQRAKGIEMTEAELAASASSCG